MVTKGQPLVRMDKTLLGADLGTNQATVNALRMKIARLEAEIGGRAPVYPASQSPAADDQLRIEKSLHAARMAELTSLPSAARARVAPAAPPLHHAAALYPSPLSARHRAPAPLAL